MTDISLRYLLFGEDRGASKAVQDVEGVANKATSAIGASFSKMGGVIGGEVGEIVGKVGEGLSSIGESARGMTPMLMAGGVAVAGVGVALSALGSKTKQAENALKQAFDATGTSMEDYEGRIQRLVKTNENLAISDVDTKNALALMIQKTNDASGSLEHMGLVADLAASKHISLESAATMVAAAMNGNTKLFKQYNIAVSSTSSAAYALTKAQERVTLGSSDLREAQAHLRDVQRQVASGAITGKNAQEALKEAHKEVGKASDTLKTKQEKVKSAMNAVKQATADQAAGFDQLGKRLDGSAKQSVNTFTGRLQVLKTKAGDVLATFGNQWGPVLSTAGTVMTMFASTLAFGTKIALGTRIQLGLLTIQTYALAAAAKVTAAAQWLLNAAMDANPIGLVVIGIAVLIAALVLLWKHSETFRMIVTGAFHGVQVAASFAINFIKDHWKLILAILGGPFIAATILIISNWHKISAGAGVAISAIKTGWNAFIGFFKGLPGKISSIAAGMWHGITDAFKGALNGIIDIWNAMPSFKIPGFSVAGHHVGGGTIGLPKMHHLATGGVLTSSGDVIVGEHGRERLRLPAGASVRPLTASDNGGGDAAGTLTVIVKSDTGEVIEQKLVRVKRKRGGRKLEFEVA